MLTNRQLQIVMHLCNGLSQEEIAATMHLSLSSVNQTIASARRAAKAKTTVHLASIVIASGRLYWTDDGDRAIDIGPDEIYDAHT
jgi:DNA-binding CsgD family transcriptional regulator